MRYLIFSYSNYYPCGGLRDVVAHCDTPEEVGKLVKSLCKDDNWHVLDLQLQTVWNDPFHEMKLYDFLHENDKSDARRAELNIPNNIIG